MPSEKLLFGRPWPRVLSNHNPLYLLSAWLVLHGLSLAFQGEAGLARVPLMTQLLCAYTLALALAGWMVVRVGKLWEDARMILLVVLLMFTALSTSYDDLCLKDPATGAVHLAFGFVFCGAVMELVLYLLGIKLPLAYRVPFYLQLAVLFAFPAWLGKLSVDGNDPAMCLGVLAFPVAAGVALLALLPAAMSAPERENGTPWPWPFFPWSIFVFVAIACGIRAWMLSVSFTPAAGVEPAFLPYFLCPIVLAMAVLGLAIGLRQGSRLTQGLSMLAMLGVIGLSFSGEVIGAAPWRTLELLERLLAGPPLLACVAVAAVALVAMIRRAAGSEFVAVGALSLLACLDTNTRSLEKLGDPNVPLLLALVAWQLGYGIWTRTMPRMAYGGIALLVAIGPYCDWAWRYADDGSWAILLTLGWLAVLPLYCRDGLALWLREAGPLLAAIAGTWIAATLGASGSTSDWMPPVAASGLALICAVYWVVFQLRWYVPAAAWVGAVAAMLWLMFGFRLLTDAQLKYGLMWYVAGCFLLAVAVAASLWKAGVANRFWAWLKNAATQGPNGEAPGG